MSDLHSSPKSEETSLDPKPTPPRLELKATRRYQLGQRQLTRLSLMIGLVAILALGLTGYRVFKNFKSQRDIVIAKDNLLALYKAMHGYASDWDNHLPAAENWTDSVEGYLSAPPGKPGGKESYLHGPGDGETVGYLYNDRAAMQSLDPATAEEAKKAIDPARLILLIEQPGAARNAHVSILPQVGPEGDASLHQVLQFSHYADDPNEATAVVLYANGHIDTVKKSDFK